MACTRQSALDYVKKARVHLVGRLNSLSVIVENLYQKRVLNEEEVSKIQTQTDDFDKTRNILDWVIKKGEAACYELLRILDITRKRTLERPLHLPEKTDVDSTQSNTFDLHYWISCFSFREDTEMDITYLKGPKPCNRYQAKLKSKAQKISNGLWSQSKAVLSNNENPNPSFNSLVLDTQGKISPSKVKIFKNKKSKKSRPKKLKTYIPVDKQGISPSELLRTDDKKILLVGKPGIGKTAVTHQMLKLWAERDNKELDYMFYFDIRETSHITSTISLKDLLFSVFSEPDDGEDEVLQDIKKNSENVIIIFDGLTDLSSPSVVRKLVEKDLLPDAKIVITCRPEVESEDFLIDWASLRVEVKGFSEQSIREYLSQMLSTQHLSNVLSNLELFTLCHVPMYALMVVACFSFKTSEDSQQPCTITEICINILRFCIKKNSVKTKKLNNYINKNCEAILSLAEVAFFATQDKTVNLRALHCGESCVHVAFLKTLEVVVGPTEKKTSSAFLHYTMQEFFAGLWLLKNPEKITGVVQQCLTEGMKHMKHVVPFICGLLNDKNLHMLKCLIPAQQVNDTSKLFIKEVVPTFVRCLLNQDDSDIEGCGFDVNILFLFQCLYELQSTEACLYLLDKLKYCLDLSKESLDPYHCCAVSYVISQSKERKICLNLEDVMISEQGLRPISGCIKNVQWCDSLQRQLWTVLLLSGGKMDYISLLDLSENELHLPVWGKRQLFETAVKVMQKSTNTVNVCLHWNGETTICQALNRSLLESLPYINTLSFLPQCSKPSEETKFLAMLFCQAAERKQQTGEKTVELLSSVCSYKTFPLNDRVYDDDSVVYQCDFLLDLFSHVNDYETQTGSSVLPALQSVYQAAPTVWSIDLSERKASLFLEVMKLQPEKKPVKLRGWSEEESDVRSFLQCLPHISQLSCHPGFYQHVCASMFVKSREEAQQLASLLQLLDFTLVLTGELPRKTCRSVGRVLELCGSRVDLILQPSKISLKGASLLFRHTSQIHNLRLSEGVALLLFRLVRTGRVACPVTIEELSLVPKTIQLSERVLSRVVSSVGSLLRYWDVRRLDLTELCIHAHLLMTLLLHHGPLAIRLCAQNFQQLPVLIHEIQDKDLTRSFLRKVGGDLTSCSLDWEVLNYLLQQSSSHTITVDLRKNWISEKNITDLLPFLDRIAFKRPSSIFVLSAIRESYKTCASHCVPSLLRALDHTINLTCTELDAVDCAALLFTLKHSDRVKLNLLWTSIPPGEMKSILFTLEKVSYLSIDRNLLLSFIHCCTASEVQQGAAAAGLLRTLQHRLDLSCSSCVDLSEWEQREALCLGAADCRAISSVLRHSSHDTWLNLRDCEVEDSGLDLLFPVLGKVRLSTSKAILLQLVSLVSVGNESYTVRRVECLCGALGGELDLSGTRLDQRACGALAVILELSEGLTELDLSHCQLTDQLLVTVIEHLHKTQVLDLSHNKITDALTDRLLQLVSTNTSIQTVRVFSNSIMDRTPFLKDKRFEMW